VQSNAKFLSLWRLALALRIDAANLKEVNFFKGWSEAGGLNWGREMTEPQARCAVALG